jgi:hypothetical protein
VVLEHWVAAAPDDLFSRVRLVELLQAERRIEDANQLGQATLEVVDDPRLQRHLSVLLRSPPNAAR